jgi:glucose dehydrogenase
MMRRSSLVCCLFAALGFLVCGARALTTQEAPSTSSESPAGQKATTYSAPQRAAPQAESEGKTQMFAPSELGSPLKTDIQALSQDAKQWPTAAKNYANTRFSELDEINTETVGNLQMAWSFSLGTNKGQEAAPLVVDNVLYVMGPYPNDVFALDATTGDLKWIYSPRPNPAAQGVACCDVVTRGLAYDDGRIFIATLDNHAVALDAKSGQEIWHTQLGEISA